ncbi:unnamed protein product [Didymodactylos carnosus]|uniref:RNA ligase (ATP) n=1 Tax=Didymodactylos carnosus TaxID=1234261 RepID=A0A815J7Q8_9BILA|nr:unnamed protein product [Didymodactylos carnosus]CAF1378355.1 unnamed protein product [Didymodactylos carnosus]CAF3864995.1 unnamed protein product [Didymodactylos carnosus]CAF4271009.1 unnamed protein product [Didymodactylos carnosus]
MLDYQGYSKISESTKSWTLEKSDNSTFKRTTWAVTEKIHGANFCFLCDQDGQRIRCGKRTELLCDTDDFFGYKRLLDATIPKIQQTYAFVRTTLMTQEKTLEKLYVFGELFGGSYPHTDVAKVPNVSAVQTGIWYCPDIEFYAFDAAVVLNGNDEKQIYLDFELCLKAFQHANLLCAEPLFIGKYEQAINFEIGFNTKLPAKLGLPSLEGNKAEGIVIKPMREIMVNTNKGLVRAILKKKIEEFSEEKFNQAQKQEKKTELSDVDLLRFEIDALVTENRLNNALSKVGRVTVTQKDKINELLNVYVKDVIDQLCEDNKDMWTNLSQNDRAMLNEELTLMTKKLIIKYFKTKPDV